ncbi:MAG TPA: DUF6390 family protein, partial [Candidatus Dormibacteraeota bacterium]|nr:DUF6390 family protein [Candidatus Dormibacteraeota bacterium]
MSRAGALLFGHYAFPPNRLGYCGPDDSAELFGYLASDRADRGLVEIERRFDGAFPYLTLIAGANGITDPFDRRVVEAYWVGNPWLERVEASPFYQSLRDRFQPRMTAGDFRSLAGKLEAAARPHHNFHVFEVYLRTGYLRDDLAAITVERMDACRVSWGRVESVGAEGVEVSRSPLVLERGRLALGPPAPVRVEGPLLAQAAGPGVQPGDHV